MIVGLWCPTIKILKCVDDLWRPLFNEMGKQAKIESSFELVQILDKWSRKSLDSRTSVCATDVVKLYKMTPQVDGILSLK